MLKGFIRQPQAAECEERLEQEIQAVRNRRASSLGNDGILVIEIKGEINTVVNDKTAERENLVICFDAYDKKVLRSDLSNRVSAIVAAMRIGSDNDYALESIGDGSYLLSPGGKVIHSFSVQMGSPTLYVSRQIGEERARRIREDIDLLLKEDKLSNVIRLFSHSLDRKMDSFRTFVSAWSAMEIFIAKVFPLYEKMLVAEIAKASASPGLQQYLNRISDVMSGEYSLADKFAVISVFLDCEAQTKDIDRFRHIKKIRDNLFHGEDVSDYSLPNRELLALFEKYFRNHVRGNAHGKNVSGTSE